MDMSYDNGGTHHAQRDDSYSFLSDIDRSAVERMGSTVGKDAIMAILSGLDRDVHHSAIAKFIQHELDEAKEKKPCLTSKAPNRQRC